MMFSKLARLLFAPSAILLIASHAASADKIWIDQTTDLPRAIHTHADRPLAQTSFTPEVWAIAPPPVWNGPRNTLRVVLSAKEPLPAGTDLVIETEFRTVPIPGLSGQGGLVLDLSLGRMRPDNSPETRFRHIFVAGEQWESFTIPVPAFREDLNEWAIVLSPSFFEQPVELRNFRIRSRRPGESLEPPLVYAGQAADAPWRRIANERIRTHRMSDLNIRVVDPLGNPVEGARVSVNQLRHAYPFGTAAVGSRITDADITFRDPNMTREQFLKDNLRYRAELKRLFNYVVFENDLKWPFWSGNKGNFSQDTTLRAFDWLRNNDLPAKGHTLIWASWRMTPDWLEPLKDNPAALQAAILRHIRDAAAATRNHTHAWDVLNEPMSHRDIIELLGHDAVAEWFRTARAELPGQKLLLNEFDIVGNGGNANRRRNLYRLIDDLRKADALPDTLGLQSHFWSDRLTPPERIWEILDEVHAATGLPLAATEFDTNFPNDQVQADYTRDFLTAWFSHPATNSFIMWGFWGGAHWFGERGAMFMRDWTPKPNLAAYEQLVFKDWWTRADLTTDSAGATSVRAFHGRHEIRVELDGRPASVRRVDLPAGGLDIEIILHPARSPQE